MFRIYLGLFLLIMSVSAQAQPQLSEYYPIGTTWEEVFTRVNYSPDTYTDGVFIRSHFSIDSDTLINDNRYKIVIQTTIEDVTEPSKVGETLKFLLREQGDSILISDNLIVVRERLIYNFNWQENDSILVSARNKYEIEGLTHSYETLLDGNTYECYSFSSYKFNGDRKYIYKSIGQTIGGLIDGLADGVRTSRREYLTKFTRNNVLIYENDIPTPQINAIYDVSYKEKSKRQDCYTLQGVKVDATNLSSGIYIVNGKKCVIK